MGDNRDDSADSRYWGFVPESHLVGKGSVNLDELERNAKTFGSISESDTLTKIINKL